MLRKLIALILLSVLAAAAVGCTGNSPQDPAETKAPEATNAPEETGQPAAPENRFVITDGSGTELGRIDNGANFTAVGGGLFYSVLTLEEYAFTGVAEYRFFSLKDGSDVLLGTLPDQGYEAGFARTELDGMIFTLAVQGNPAGDAPVPLLLLAFDTANKTMKTYTVSEYGFPYASMTASGGKLYIMNHETSADEAETIYEFDPGTEEIKALLTFDSSVDSLRGVCAAAGGFYLLRLRLSDGENEMFVDLYDENGAKLAEQPITDILLRAITEIPSILDRQDASGQLGVNVSRFAVTDGRYLVYENFSISRAVIDLTTGETLFAGDDNYSVSVGSGGPVIYRLDFDAQDVQEPELLVIENGEAVPVPFKADAAHRLIQRVTVSESGLWAVLMTDDFPAQNASGMIRVWSAK